MSVVTWLIVHNACQRNIEVLMEDPAKGKAGARVPDVCPECSRSMALGFDLVGPVTPEYLAARAGQAGVDVTPAAAELAATEGVTLEEIGGSGPDGLVTRADVEESLLAEALAGLGTPMPGVPEASPTSDLSDLGQRISDLVDIEEGNTWLANKCKHLIDQAIEEHLAHWHIPPTQGDGPGDYPDDSLH